MFGMKFHVLTKGFGYDLKKRAPDILGNSKFVNKKQKLSEVIL
jgi:hypothetical protein